MEQNEKKKDILATFLLILLGLVGAFEICILSYIGVEMVPYLLQNRDTPAQVEQSEPSNSAAPSPEVESA